MRCSALLSNLHGVNKSGRSPHCDCAFHQPLGLDRVHTFLSGTKLSTKGF
jgi:hypothetical protein